MASGVGIQTFDLTKQTLGDGLAVENLKRLFAAGLLCVFSKSPKWGLFLVYGGFVV